MAGRFDPSLLIHHLMLWLAGQGCEPELRASQLAATEAAAVELLLCLDVEPTRVGVEDVRGDAGGNSGPGWPIGRPS